MLYLLVGRYPEENPFLPCFQEEILNMSLDIKTSRDDILESMNRFLARFPVRVVRLTSLGRKDRMLEINTRRIFLDAEGMRLDVYGKTVVMLDAEGQTQVDLMTFRILLPELNAKVSPPLNTLDRKLSATTNKHE